jgi:hypothetical protein
MLGQLFEKIMGPKFACIFIVALMHIIGLLAYAFILATPHGPSKGSVSASDDTSTTVTTSTTSTTTSSDYNTDDHSAGGGGSNYAAEGLESAFIFGLLWALLHTVYKKYHIKHPGYFCVCVQLIWCVPCKLCQIWRHVHDFANHPEKQPCCDFSATGSKASKECCDCGAVKEDYAWDKVEEGGGPLLGGESDSELDNADVEASVVAQPVV